MCSADNTTLFVHVGHAEKKKRERKILDSVSLKKRQSYFVQIRMKMMVYEIE